MKLILTISIIASLNLSACGSKSVDAVETKTEEKAKVMDNKSTNSSTESATKQNLDQSKPAKKIQITDTYWKLITLDGQEIEETKNPHDQPHFMLNLKEQRITGNDSCNGFFGSFTLEDGNRIKFNQLAGTKRFCPETVVDQNNFLQIFAQTNTYVVRDELLELRNGTVAPLAVFSAITNKAK